MNKETKQTPPDIFAALHPLALEIVGHLADGGKTLAIAESCTGGLLGAVLTDVPGASKVFAGGLVAYSVDAKVRFGVSPEILRRHGAVSTECAADMARAAAVFLNADIGASLTGIAGPGGGTQSEPVGVVYVGLFSRWTGAVASRFLFDGDRAAVRARAVENALSGILALAAHS